MALHRVSFFYLVRLVSLDRVIQVVMDDLVYYPFHFVEKSNPEHSRKNCKVLRVVRGKGEFFTIPKVFALEGALEKLFKDGMILLLFLYGTKSRQNNGPNGQPAQCMTPSEFYKNRFIQRYWPATNRISCFCFCCGSIVLQASPD